MAKRRQLFNRLSIESMNLSGDEPVWAIAWTSISLVTKYNPVLGFFHRIIGTALFVVKLGHCSAKQSMNLCPNSSKIHSLLIESRDSRSASPSIDHSHEIILIAPY